eukprot:6797131-Prymnesium_polylepis.1
MEQHPVHSWRMASSDHRKPPPPAELMCAGPKTNFFTFTARPEVLTDDSRRALQNVQAAGGHGPLPRVLRSAAASAAR